MGLIRGCAALTVTASGQSHFRPAGRPGECPPRSPGFLSGPDARVQARVPPLPHYAEWLPAAGSTRASARTPTAPSLIRGPHAPVRSAESGSPPPPGDVVPVV